MSIYSDYIQAKRNVFFTDDYMLCRDEHTPSIDALFSLTGLAQKALQLSHNALVEEKESGPVKNETLRKIAIGAGFFSLIFLGAIETVARFAIMWIGLFIAAALFICGQKEIAEQITGISIGGFGTTALFIGQAAVSLYSHCAHKDEPINYEGQANKYLFHMDPVTLKSFFEDE